MVHVRFINDQETVVTVPVRPDVDRWVLAVMNLYASKIWPL